MKNREVFLKDPLSFELINNGVSKSRDRKDKEQLKTLRSSWRPSFVTANTGKAWSGFSPPTSTDLQTRATSAWVSASLAPANPSRQDAALPRWTTLSRWATARSIAHLPREVKELFVELTNRSKRFGG